jgi:hypothetical protein
MPGATNILTAPSHLLVAFSSRDETSVYFEEYGVLGCNILKFGEGPNFGGIYHHCYQG